MLRAQDVKCRREPDRDLLGGPPATRARTRVIMRMDQTPIEFQRAFWNGWNTIHESPPDVALAQADVITSWLDDLARNDLNIIDIGCGTGWLSSRLTRFGSVTATDLCDQHLARAATGAPEVRFVAGNFMELDFGICAYDVAVSLEMLSHVADQREFLKKISSLLKANGYLLLATQNRPALERNVMPARKPGQLSKWVDRDELRQLLEPNFGVKELFSITPQFNRGFLRIPNSKKLRRIAQTIGLGGLAARVKKLQEEAWLGWTLMALARKRG